MKPESTLGLLLELLEILAAPGALPADARVGRFFRARRFLGSHDRRLIGDAAYSWLRHFPRARARWKTWCTAGEASSPPFLEKDVPRLNFLPEILVLARDHLFPWSFDETLKAAQGIRPLATPGWDLPEEGGWPADALERFAAELSLPPWLAERLVKERGDEAARRLGAALLEPATVDLRVSPESALQVLLLATLLGLAGGFLPARRAARLSPVEALRRR